MASSEARSDKWALAALEIAELMLQILRRTRLHPMAAPQSGCCAWNHWSDLLRLFHAAFHPRRDKGLGPFSEILIGGSSSVGLAFLPLPSVRVILICRHFRHARHPSSTRIPGRCPPLSLAVAPALAAGARPCGFPSPDETSMARRTCWTSTSGASTTW